VKKLEIRRRLIRLLIVFVGVVAAGAVGTRFFAGPQIRGAVWGSKLGHSEADYKVTRERAETVIAALERWKARQGRYPVTLEELVPSELPRLDPPLVGKGVWEYGRPQAEVFELGFFVGPVYESDQYRSSTGKWTVDR